MVKDKDKNKKFKSLDKIVNKTILKQSKVVLVIKEKKVPSVLNDENRFFKSTYEKEKALFFQWRSIEILGGKRMNKKGQTAEVGLFYWFH